MCTDAENGVSGQKEDGVDILILSDSHGRSDLVERAVSRCHPDLILFCGDGLRDLTYQPLPCPLCAVKGNCDIFPPPLPCVGGEVADEMLVCEGGMRMLLIHGHTYGIKHGLELAIQRASELDADALIFGHTHHRVNVTLSPGGEYPYLKKALHLFNPGSVYESPYSFGTLTLRNGIPLFHHGELD